MRHAESPSLRRKTLVLSMSDQDTKPKDEKKPDAALTRRQWLLSLGGAAVLAGFRGAPGDGSALAAQGAAGQSAVQLPPGLFLPSYDHLTHVLMLDARFHPIPPGTEVEYVSPRNGPYVPQALGQGEFAVVRRLVEIILGENLKNSEAPAEGAPASIYDEVAEWIDLVVASAPSVRTLARNLPAEQRALAVAYFGSEAPVRELETFEPERTCREGFAWLDEEARRRFSKAFGELDAEQQLEVVKAVADDAAGRTASAGTRFFDFLKSETIRCYYTSKQGLHELDYKGNGFYAQSPGCGLTPAPAEAPPSREP